MIQLPRKSFSLFSVDKIQTGVNPFLIWFLTLPSTSPPPYSPPQTLHVNILLLIFFKYIWWLQLLCPWPFFPFPKGSSFDWAGRKSLLLLEMSSSSTFFRRFSELPDQVRLEHNSMIEHQQDIFPHLSDKTFFFWVS